MSNETVIVRLLEKEYQVACPPGQQQALARSAQHLDQQMRTIKSNGKVIGLERIAVMAALNITNELLQNRTEPMETNEPVSTNGNQLKSLNDRLDEALNRFRQLEIS